jgi:hypothetical protein
VPPASAAQPTAVPEEVAAPDVVAGRRPVAESAEVAARPRAAAAERDVEVAVLPRVAVAAVRLPGAARDAEVPRQGVQGEAPAVRPLAAAWAAAHPCLQELA